MNWVRIISATIIAATIGFLIHLLYGQGIAIEYVQKAAENGLLNDVIKQPYPNWIIITASLTALIPAFGKVFVYILIQDKLPSKNKIIKGMIFGVLLLFVGDDLLRMPIMGIVTGNPFDVVFVQSLEKWIIYPIMGIVIAILVPDKLFSRTPNKIQEEEQV
ncbi:hypothetical protein [Sulfurimonas sp.]|uniref:hypothetical protein n=1 Tax=Sulfurimonas sp. TaxID=2022749 RepID=UPI002B49D76A|nr:hypothetical protein [Sulfurimonas sp.]